MQETILVVFIVSVIFALLIFVYYSYVIKDIEASGGQLSEQEALVQLASITRYPELRCETSNCVDMLKAISFKIISDRNKDYYLRTFGQKKIFIEQVYPEVKTDEECSPMKFNQFDYPNNCKFWIIYEEVPPKYTAKQITSIPVSLFFPEKDEYRLGRLNIEVYKWKKRKLKLWV